MKKIGGNVSAQIQIKTTAKNDIGERVATWSTVQTLKGFLDMQTGNAQNVTYDAKVQDSTHIFICDYTPLNCNITSENSRLLISGKTYEVTMIDNPMNLNYQLEISLKYTGGIVNG